MRLCVKRGGVEPRDTVSVMSGYFIESLSQLLYEDCSNMNANTCTFIPFFIICYDTMRYVSRKKYFMPV